jgi:hypothetical protein
MRKILNYLLTVLVLFVGWKISPTTIVFASTGSIFITALVMWLISLAFILLIVPLIIGAALGDGLGGLIILITIGIALLAVPIELCIADALLTGFAIHGFWTYVLTTLALFIFTIEKSSSDN